nr:RecName: Full=Defensin-like protein; AltName: Full=Coccinin [Phaseolus coccineus]
KQTENLADTY